MKLYDRFIINETIVSVPMLQYKFNLSYLAALRAIDDMVKDGAIEKIEGDNYKVKLSPYENKEKDDDDDDIYDDDDEDFFNNFFHDEEIDKVVKAMKDCIVKNSDDVVRLVDEEFINDSIVKISFKENGDGTYYFTDNGYTYGRLLIKFSGLNKYKENKMKSYLKKYNLELVESSIISRFVSYEKALSSYINLYSVIVLLSSVLITGLVKSTTLTILLNV